MAKKGSAEDTIRDIKRKARRKYSAEEKIRIVMEGLRGEMTVAELCRREGIAQSLYYKWSKDFLEAGKARRLLGVNVVIPISAHAPNQMEDKSIFLVIHRWTVTRMAWWYHC